jgi:hypothetical protein
MITGAPDLPSLIPTNSYLSISDTPDTKFLKELRIFTDSPMLNNVQLIAQENHCQLLDFSVTHPRQYISNNPGIDRLSMQHRVDVSYPETLLAYSRPAQ